jgi:hypothetical protein
MRDAAFAISLVKQQQPEEMKRPRILGTLAQDASIADFGCRDPASAMRDHRLAEHFIERSETRGHSFRATASSAV